MATRESNQRPEIYLLPSMGKTVRLPVGVSLCRCRYSRERDDLLLSAGDQPTVVLRHYYSGDRAPYLRDHDGDVLSGELARLLAGLSENAVDALMQRGLKNANQTG